jgi:hypothetical protein
MEPEQSVARIRWLTTEELSPSVASASVSAFEPEWSAGAEREWLRRTGKPMTRADLEQLLRRYPGVL